MRIASLTALVAAIAVTSVAGAAQPPKHNISWGKAGVSFEDYTADSWACAGEAITQDISKTEPVRALITASRELDQAALTDWMYGSAAGPGYVNSAAGAGIDSARVMMKYRPDLQFAAVRQIQYRTMVSCLIRRGYTPFELTADQVGHLRKLRRGSVERRAYLHSLGSDPAVLGQQSA